MPYALSTSTCGFRRSSSVQFMPSRSASPWKLTSRRRWLRSRVRSIGAGRCSVAIRVILPANLERACRGHTSEHTPPHTSDSADQLRMKEQQSKERPRSAQPFGHDEGGPHVHPRPGAVVAEVRLLWSTLGEVF